MDIVERLRDRLMHTAGTYTTMTLIKEAADEIEQLRQECDALRRIAESKMDELAACERALEVVS